MKFTLGSLANLATIIAILITGIVGYGRLQQGQDDQKAQIEQISIQQRRAIDDLRASEDSKIAATENARKEDIINFEHQIDSMIAQQNVTNQQVLSALESIQNRIDRLLEAKRSEIQPKTAVQ